MCFSLSNLNTHFAFSVASRSSTLAHHNQTLLCSSLIYDILMNIFHIWGQTIRKFYYALDSQREGNAQKSFSLIRYSPWDLKLPVLKWQGFQSFTVSTLLPFSLFLKLDKSFCAKWAKYRGREVWVGEEAYEGRDPAPSLLTLLML